MDDQFGETLQFFDDFMAGIPRHMLHNESTQYYDEFGQDEKNDTPAISINEMKKRADQKVKKIQADNREKSLARIAEIRQKGPAPKLEESDNDSDDIQPPSDDEATKKDKAKFKNKHKVDPSKMAQKRAMKEARKKKLAKRNAGLQKV